MQPHSGLLSGGDNTAISSDGAGTFFHLTSWPNSQALLKNIHSIADPMMHSSMHHRHSMEVTLWRAHETSSFKMPFQPRAQTSSVCMHRLYLYHIPKYCVLLFNCIIWIAYTAKPAPRLLCFQVWLNSEDLLGHFLFWKVLDTATIYALSHQWTPLQFPLLPNPNSEGQVKESNAPDPRPVLHLAGVLFYKPQPDRASRITLPQFYSWTSAFILCPLLMFNPLL